jgi:hypothetical protein
LRKVAVRSVITSGFSVGYITDFFIEDAMRTAARAKPRGRSETVRLESSTGSAHHLVAAASVSEGGVRKVLAASALLALVTLLLYSPVGQHPFIDYDDYFYVVENAHVKSGLKWDTLTWALTSTEESNWHPVTWLSHALDCQFYGLKPSGHHWTSVVLHAANVVLLFLLLQRVTGTFWRSLAVAGLFALHPLNVESVAWVAERKNVLSTLFFLLALGSYGWYARRPKIPRYLVVALFFVLGLASKPMVITLPFVLLLIDSWPLRRIKGWSEPASAFPTPQQDLSRILLEKLPLLAISVGSAIVTLIAQEQVVVTTVALPVGVRLRTVPYAYATYLWKMLWPAKLAPIYPHPGLTLPIWVVILDAIVLIAVSAEVWRQRRRYPYLAVGWAWFLGTAIPVIGIVQVGDQVVADRYAYVPLIGIFITIAWGATALADRMRVGVPVRVVVGTFLLGAISFATWHQISYWSDSVTLWQHALKVTTTNAMAEGFLANDLLLQDRSHEAMVHMRNYANLEPLDPMAHVRVAADYQDHGQWPLAIKEYEAAIRGTVVLNRRGFPGLTLQMLAVTHANLAVIYSQIGDQRQAQASMNKALATDAPTVDQMMGQLVQALATNRNAQGYLRLGCLLRLVGHEEEAQQAFSWAKRLDPQVVLPPGS